MSLTLTERRLIATQAQCFEGGTFGRSLTCLTPHAVLAQHRGVTFDLVHSQIGDTVLPHSLDAWEVCDRALWDLIQATGCTDRLAYHDLIETLGPLLLERLTDGTHDPADSS